MGGKGYILVFSEKKHSVANLCKINMLQTLEWKNYPCPKTTRIMKKTILKYRSCKQRVKSISESIVSTTQDNIVVRFFGGPRWLNELGRFGSNSS